MNPVTAALLEQVDWPELETWIKSWDRLEALYVETYRSAEVTQTQQRDYRRLRADLRSGYGSWREALKTYWQETRVGGHPLVEDPFVALTAEKKLDPQKTDWAAMQLLPAAREALNALLIDRIGAEDGASGD